MLELHLNLTPCPSAIAKQKRESVKAFSKWQLSNYMMLVFQRLNMNLDSHFEIYIHLQL